MRIYSSLVRVHVAKTIMIVSQVVFQTYHLLSLYFRKIIFRRLISLLKSKVFLHFPSLITINNFLIHLHMTNMMMIVLSSQFLILHQKVSFFRKIMMLFSLHGLIAIWYRIMKCKITNHFMMIMLHNQKMREKFFMV